MRNLPSFITHIVFAALPGASFMACDERAVPVLVHPDAAELDSDGGEVIDAQSEAGRLGPPCDPQNYQSVPGDDACAPRWIEGDGCAGGVVLYPCGSPPSPPFNGITGRRPAGLVEPAGVTARTIGDVLAQCAHLEAASVEAFMDLAHELAAHGAPALLVRRARRASLAAWLDTQLTDDERRQVMLERTRALNELERELDASDPPASMRALGFPTQTEAQAIFATIRDELWAAA